MPLPLNFFILSSDNYWVAQKKIQKKKIQIRYLHLVKPSAIGFTGIGPMLSFASLNYSKSVASGFTLHKTRGVSHKVALPFTFKSISRQKKNYGKSNISPCKNITFKKSSLKETKIFQHIITL